MKKTMAITMLAIIAIGGLGLSAAFANAMPFGNWGMGMGQGLGSMMSVQRSWVHLNGQFTTWGKTDVNGTLMVQALSTRADDSLFRLETSASAMWNISVTRQDGNFSYSFDAARLVKVNYTALDFEGSNFFMNGTWNVYNVTVSSIVITNGDLNTGYSSHRETDTKITPIATGAYGELDVTTSWSKFVLSITGIDPLSGTLRSSLMRHTEINRFKVSDDTTTDKVTRQDLVTVAKCYGAVAGSSNYDQKLDFNLHYKIDITDVATVAANIQQ
jgi:hypothetical protein